MMSFPLVYRKKSLMTTMKSLYRTRRFAIVLGDIFCFAAGFWVALTLRHFSLPSTELYLRHLPLFAVTFMLWIAVGYINGLYDLSHLKSKRQFSKKFLQTSTVALMVGVVFFYLFPSKTIAPKTILLLTVITSYVLSALWHLAAQRLLRLGNLHARLVFVGCTNETLELISLLERSPEQGYEVAAVIDPDGEVDKGALGKNIEVYQSLKAIRPALTNHKATVAVVAPHLQQSQEAMRELYELLFWPVQIIDLTSFYELLTGRIPPSIFSESWFLEHLKQVDKPVYTKLRRLLDYIAMVGLMAIFLGTFPLVALAIKLSSKGPIFFKQTRSGLFGEHFTLIKYRSMYVLSEDGSAETNGAEFAKKGDVRVTPVGRFLRSTRIDELPQVINLMKREMTLIGPRPERPEIAEKLTVNMPYYPLRHVVRPGLMGWAILHQNYTDTLEKTLQKLQYDLFYIKNRSLVMDLSIILKTIGIVLRRSGQ